MRTALLTAVLLAVECGRSYKVLRDPLLDVSEQQIATGSQEGLLYRISARGTNSCCLVNIDVLNTATRSVAVAPYAAELTSANCQIAAQWVAYIAGDEAEDFAAVDRRVDERGLEVRSSDKPLWSMANRGQQFVVTPRSFLKLSYYFGDFQQRCAPYAFKLRLDSSRTIRAAFEP